MSYVPFDVDHYERQEELSDLERTILSNRRYRSDWAYLQSSVPRLVIPLIDLVAHAGVSDRLAVSSVSVILWHVSRTD
ncbi:integrase, partial [Pseudomonas syringae]